MRQGHRLSVALTWAVLTIVVILYWRRGGNARQGQNYHHSIPVRKIWQVTGDNKVQPAMDCAEPWITSNPGWTHHLHTDKTATVLAARLYRGGGGGGGGDNDLARALRELRSTGMRADLIRYLVLGLEGGVYTDLPVKRE